MTPVSVRCSRGESGRDAGLAVDVVWPSVEQQHSLAVARPDVDVANLDYARGDRCTGPNALAGSAFIRRP
jgi:hypothetical protein